MMQSMRLVTRNIFVRQDASPGSLFPGATTSVSQENVQVHRYGRQRASDTYNDWIDTFSVDMGTDGAFRWPAMPAISGSS